MQVFKVTHSKSNIETVFLVKADSSRDAQTKVLDSLYERSHTVDMKLTPERIAGDTFGLLQASQHSSWTNAALCKHHGCSVGVVPWDDEEPYRLYALNTQTGEMS